MVGKHLFPWLLLPAMAFAALFACGDDEGAASPTDPTGDGGTPPVRAEHGLDERPPNPTCKAPPRPPSSVPVRFESAFTNLGGPMMMAQMPGDGSRWFVAQRGTMNNQNANIISFTVADPATRTTVGSVGPIQYVTNGEGGLLGMAFHPACNATNCRLYVTWLTTGGANGSRSVVGYLTSTDNGATFGSYQQVLSFDQINQTNHKGGGIAFGKDGYLYVSFGDGGGGNDPANNGQNPNVKFAKVLRIDVDNVPGGAPAEARYGIPADNPFANGGGEPATFAMGFRNPFRISIDRESGDLWVGDVGQNQWEEIDDRVKLGGNYGWPCREGKHDYLNDNQGKCPSNVGHIDPIVEHEHDPPNSRSITGGVVYRGKAMPALVGSYIYGDYETQELFILSFDDVTGEPRTTKLEGAGIPNANWVSFAEDVDGEVYAVALNQSQAWKLVPADSTPPASAFPERLSQTGCTDPADVKKPASGLVPYGVNAQLWSDGAEKERYLALPDGATITVGPDGDFDLPIGSVIMKTFSIGGKRVETRLLVRHDDGAWAGYTYEWLDDESDAVLLLGSKRKSVGAQTWYYPSRSECLRCHTEAAGRTLGLEIGQLNGDFVYTSTNRISNQLKTLAHIGMFSAPLSAPVEQLTAYPDPLEEGSLEPRARAYLHANCSMCHQPQGGGQSDMDLRFARSLAETQMCNTDPTRGDLGVSGAKLLVPGDASLSLVSLRAHALGANRMPPLASSVVDTQGLKVVDDWIAQLTACP